MQLSQIFTLSAMLAAQAQACTRIRLDYKHLGNGETVVSGTLWDNDKPTQSATDRFRDDGSHDRLIFQDYTLWMQWDQFGPGSDTFGGEIYYHIPDSRLGLETKAFDRYQDSEGYPHSLYCVWDNYSDCGAYTCGL
jgi:hypothetical protein